MSENKAALPFQSIKVIVLGLICLPLFISCAGKENAEVVFSKKSDSYKIEIATIQTKIDASGVAQCSKYSKTTRNDTVYDSYGLSLPKILAYSLDTQEKYLSKLPTDSLMKKYLKIRIENYSKQSLNYDSLLYLGLSETFNLKALPYPRVVDGYQLNIIDHAILQRFEVDCGASLIKYNDGVFAGESIQLKGLTGVVDQYVDPPIRLGPTENRCYAIDFIVNKDFEKINGHIKQYGLRFETAKFEQTFYQINLASNELTDQQSGMVH